MSRLTEKNAQSPPSAKTAGTKLTSHEYEEIKRLVDNGIYLSVSDFIRDAVRDKLETYKIIINREISMKKQKKRLLATIAPTKKLIPTRFQKI
jgi:Arc/MetJ-type ribon-helix-helix transcriptional regulator